MAIVYSLYNSLHGQTILIRVLNIKGHCILNRNKTSSVLNGLSHLSSYRPTAALAMQTLAISLKMNTNTGLFPNRNGSAFCVFDASKDTTVMQ